MELFGDRLRQLRHDWLLTQEALGALVGKNKSAICKLESGEQQPSLREALQFAAIFHLRLSQFLEEDDDEHERQRLARVQQFRLWLARGRLELVKQAEQIKHDADQLRNALEILAL